MCKFNHDHCWRRYFDMPYMWIIVLPITVALSVSEENLSSMGLRPRAHTGSVRLRLSGAACPLIGGEHSVCGTFHPDQISGYGIPGLHPLTLSYKSTWHV